MLQTVEIYHRYQLLVQAIAEAAQGCSAERHLPVELRQSVHRLDQHADQLGQILLTPDSARIARTVAEMVLLAGRARQVCLHVPEISARTRSAVQFMCGQLQELQRDCAAGESAGTNKSALP